MVDQVAIVLKAGARRNKLDVLLGEDATDELTDEVAAVEVLDPPEQNVPALEGVRHHNPWQASGLDEGLCDRALVTGRERRELALRSRSYDRWIY
jgi:hypothetical protein